MESSHWQHCNNQNLIWVEEAGNFGQQVNQFKAICSGQTIRIDQKGKGSKQDWTNTSYHDHQREHYRGQNRLWGKTRTHSTNQRQNAQHSPDTYTAWWMLSILSLIGWVCSGLSSQPILTTVMFSLVVMITGVGSILFAAFSFLINAYGLARTNSFELVYLLAKVTSFFHPNQVFVGTVIKWKVHIGSIVTTNITNSLCYGLCNDRFACAGWSVEEHSVPFASLSI